MRIRYREGRSYSVGCRVKWTHNDDWLCSFFISIMKTRECFQDALDSRNERHCVCVCVCLWVNERVDSERLQMDVMLRLGKWEIKVTTMKTLKYSVERTNRQRPLLNGKERKAYRLQSKMRVMEVETPATSSMLTLRKATLEQDIYRLKFWSSTLPLKMTCNAILNHSLQLSEDETHS